MPSVTVYFHAPCFDGIVSAVLAGSILRRSLSVTDIVYEPVGYALKPKWGQMRLRGPCAVVDFLYHPDAAFWADHHATAFVNGAPPPKTRPRHATLYDASAPSCAGLIWRTHGTEFPMASKARFQELVLWADRIDAARYESVAEVMKADAPALQLDLTLLLGDSDGYSAFLAQELEVRTLEEVAAHPVVVARLIAVRSKLARGFERLERAIQLRDGVAIFDVDAEDVVVPRYGAFALFPTARASIGLHRRARAISLLAMVNPWTVPEHPHVGRVCERFGGGGHDRVGSVSFDARDAVLAREATDDLAAALGDSSWIRSSTSTTSSPT